MKTTDRLVILGLDGATWTVLDPMIQNGVMPNLAALLGRSAYGTLRSTIPPVTSAAWTTMMTGCGPAQHGVFDHRYYDAAAGQLRVNHSGRVKVPTFWHLLSDAGRSVISLNVPVTFPPLKVKGVVVSGMDAPHLEAALSGSPEFAQRLAREVPGYALKFFWKKPPRNIDEMNAAADPTIELFKARAEGAWSADRHVPDWSTLMVQFQNLDPFQHRAWRYLNVDETGIDDPAMNAAAQGVMRGLDAAIGRVCELAEKRGATVMVVSDHGFGSCKGRVHVNRVLLDAGIARLPSKFGTLAMGAEKIRGRLALWNAKRGTPEARTSSFDQSVSAQFPFDWKRTLAFAPHQDTAAMIYLNTASRSAGAPLQTFRQIDDARQATIAALADARHPQTGEPLFAQIIDMASTHNLDPAREGYPDIIALPDVAYWVRTKLAPGKSWVEADDALPGTHRPEGIVAIAGPGVTPGRNLRSDLRDIAPTVLRLFDLPIPAHIEGRPIIEAWGESNDAPPAAQAHQPMREDQAHGLAGPHQPEFEYTPEEQAIIEQRLADLGYLE
ncbi:alkaline phosphatase family protein [Isosphaeraceae bacterium EP7]